MWNDGDYKMSKKIDGVDILLTDDFCLFHINYLSEELKNIIRKELSAICVGLGNSSLKTNSYSNILKEFIKRYESKNNKQQKGMIGELLLHILLCSCVKRFKSCSPFFNMEERSVKKGFDIILRDPKTMKMWFAESKAGEGNKSSNSLMKSLITIAKNDLLQRVAEDSSILWRNAINSATNAMKDRKAKTAIRKILDDLSDDFSSGSKTLKDLNVILSGCLFKDLNDKVEKKVPEEKISELKAEGCFAEQFIIAIQKNTYKAVYEFLKAESLKTNE